jgi:predicted phosphodiesterase
MRYAVISDVHANLEALTAVLTAIEKLEVDQILCLGDLVGYHANPNECVRLVHQYGIRSIAGNHDRAAINVYEPTDFGAAARHAILLTRGLVTAETSAYLARLPTLLQIGEKALLVHGALHPVPNERTRLNSNDAVLQSFAVMKRDFPERHVCFYGHMHRPVVYESREGVVDERTGHLVTLRPDVQYLINPGSVGQPRDGDPRSSFLVYDESSDTVQFQRVPFDRAACREKAEEAGLLHQSSLAARIVSKLSGQAAALVQRLRPWPGADRGRDSGRSLGRR